MVCEPAWICNEIIFKRANWDIQLFQKKECNAHKFGKYALL